MMNLVDLTGRTILVTGASTGIGRACAVMAAKLGARVALTARREAELQETRALMERSDDHICLPCDLTAAGAVDELAGKVAAFGKLDGLVFSTGIASAAPVGFIADTVLEAAYRTNCFSFIGLLRCFSKPKYRNSPFSAVAISSVSAHIGWAGGALYCGSKAALAGTVRALAIELAAKGMRVNSISPSHIHTQMYEKDVGNWNTEEKMKALLAKQPLGLGEPEQVASVVSFLLSDASSFITAADIPVDGGFLAQ